MHETLKSTYVGRYIHRYLRQAMPTRAARFDYFRNRLIDFNRCSPNAHRKITEQPHVAVGPENATIGCEMKKSLSTFDNNKKNKKLSYCWETVQRESMPRIAEMDVEMTN